MLYNISYIILFFYYILYFFKSIYYYYSRILTLEKADSWKLLLRYFY